MPPRNRDIPPENPPETTTAADSPEELKARNAELEIQLAKAQSAASTLEAQLIQAGVTPDIMDLAKAKMRAGLSREDAIQCARRQVLHDKTLKIEDEKARQAAQIAAGQSA